MSNKSPFGITSGGMGASGSCIMNRVSILPWLKAKAEAEETDLETWLTNYADGVTSGYGSREQIVEADLILAATFRCQPEEFAQIRQMIPASFSTMTVMIAVGEFITDMEKK